MYWYILLAVFAVNIWWAARNWKKEWDEMMWAWKNRPLVGLKGRVFTKALFSVRVILTAALAWGITIIFPPFSFIGGLLVAAAYIVSLSKSSFLKVSGYPIICTMKFIGDLAITAGATSIFGFYGFFGSAMAIFMSNMLSITFFTPKKNHKSSWTEATDDFSEDLREYDKKILSSNGDVEDILAKYGIRG